MKDNKSFPRYFIVEDIPVKVEKDTENDEVFATNAIGNPYSPFKALVEGVEVNQEEFKRASKSFAASS